MTFKSRLCRGGWQTLRPSQVYPGPQAQESNQLHQLDLVGPIYLKGQSQRYYIFVRKDAFDRAVRLKLGRSRKMNEVMTFLIDCWKSLGLPAQVQFDNAREFTGWGRAARSLSRLIRLCLRFGVEAVFIPPRRPQRQGSVENFNGWFQPLLFDRHWARPEDLARELRRLEATVNTQLAHQRLGGLTPEQYRRRHKLQKLPPQFAVPLERLPLAASARDLHSAGEYAGQHLTAEPEVKSRQATAGTVRQSGTGHESAVG